MIQVRKAQDRGHFNFGWLDTFHTFSFGEYFDPEHVHFRALRVINEDKVAPGAGFPTHPHRDMEIVTYVLEGALEHKDSMGNGSIIRPGDVQRMSAGTGITHSEFNPSKSDGTHLLQIWLLPERKGLTPSYQQTRFDEAERRGRLRLIASRDGREGSVTIHQDAAIYAGLLDGQDAVHNLAFGRHTWIQVAHGAVTVNGQEVKQGDGVALSGESEVKLTGSRQAEVLLFDLA
jgi:redox-sensitive bicupin YhaK (pirin superfamily)